MADIAEEFIEELEEVETRPFNATYFKRLLGYLKPYRRQLLVVLGFIVLSTVSALLEPFVIALVIDRGVPNKDVTLVLGLVGVADCVSADCLGRIVLPHVSRHCYFSERVV